MMIKFIQKSNSGYSLLELVFYISLFTFLSLVVINSVLVMTRSLKETSFYSQLQTGGSMMGTISREVRRATSINSISSSDLVLNTTDDAGDSKTVEFVLSSANIQFLENDVFTGNLNSFGVAVGSLSFTEIDMRNGGKAIKIFFTISLNSDLSGQSYDFYDTIVLRSGY